MNLTLALGYVIVILHNFWRGPEMVKAGSIFEVARGERCQLVSGGVARDATAVEIAEFRGEPLPSADEVPPDASEFFALLAEAKTELAALEQKRDGLQNEVSALEQGKGALGTDLEELNDQVTEASAELESLGTQKAALAAEVAALEKAKKAAAKAG